MALARVSCIWLGPECYYFQGVDIRILMSSKDSTSFAPVATLLVSSLFLISGLYALSAARVIRRLPFLKIGIFVIGIICLQRGLHAAPNLIMHPPLRNLFSISAATIWIVSGALIIWGYLSFKPKKR